MCLLKKPFKGPRLGSCWRIAWKKKECLLYLSLDEESLLEDPEERVPADLTAGGFCNIELGHFSHSQRIALFSKF